MHEAEILIAGLLVAVAGLSALARRLSVPYPIVLVLGGALFGFIPACPTVRLDPNVVFVVFLPPLVYGAAFFANLGDIRANLRAVTLSSVGLVLVTMVAVAVVAHALIPDFSWAAAFTLGAVVSPTDPLAGASIMRRLEFPRRLVSAVEAEGFSTTPLRWSHTGGCRRGGRRDFSLGNARPAVRGRRRGRHRDRTCGGLDDRRDPSSAPRTRRPASRSPCSAATPRSSGNALGASGVLAAVTTGIYMGVRGPSIIPARTRLQGFFVWDMLDFI